VRLARMFGESSPVRRAYRRFYWSVMAPLSDVWLFRSRTFGYPGAARLFKTVEPYTMVGLPRLLNAFELARCVETSDMRGAIVECGVFKGGCVGLMAKVSADAGAKRKVWLFDSFEGLPQPTALDGAMAEEYSDSPTSGELVAIDRCVGLLETVEELLFDKLQLRRENIVIRKGWFQDTLPAAKDEIGEIAILRLDGDWYESTKVCLENLYDRVVAGGFVIIDDYGYWEGCKRATDEFLANRGLSVRLAPIDSSGVFFVKPSQTP
jgi:O-methyltransferase